MFDTKYEDLPEFVTDSGWQIHMVRSHERQIVIGAANSGLDSFHLQWEKERCDGDDRCGSPANIYYNRGWQTRFSRGWHAPSPDTFVALYSDCRGEWMIDGEEATVWDSVGERLFALVLHIEYDRSGRELDRTMSYMQSDQVLSRHTQFEGLNFIDQAYAAAHLQRRKDLTHNEWGRKLWNRRAKTHIPSVARQALHKVIDQMESQFGQGKDFFAKKHHS